LTPVDPNVEPTVISGVANELDGSGYADRWSTENDRKISCSSLLVYGVRKAYHRGLGIFLPPINSSLLAVSLSLWERAGVREHFRALHTCPA
jgi:hypothetical protein